MGKKYDLSILIPALKEEFLNETIEDILRNKRGNTEVIVGLDGEWGVKGIPDHPDVRVVHVGKNKGQRGITNFICRLSKAKYVAKCDAHVAFDEGFDVKLMEAVAGHDDWTIVPVMRNLHVFNWVCKECGAETYQGATPEGCKDCHVNTPEWFEKKIVWRAKPSPNSSAFKFTPSKLQFKYFNSLKSRQQKSGEQIVETMSLQGSFFMLTREKYWELTISDETWGGWGQQGTEVALKTWLSGGRVVCHMGTWYAHMFRTQNDFAFPWNGNGISQGSQQHRARKASQDLFFNNKWDKQTRPLSWLIERFWDVLQEEPESDDDPKWTQQDLDRLKEHNGRFKEDGFITTKPQPNVLNIITPHPTKGIIYYTDNQLNLRLATKVQKQLKSIGLPITSASLKPMDNMGKNVHIKMERGYLAYYTQILAALEASDADIVYMCEHDVLYHPSHFDFTPPEEDKFYYNHNWWTVRQSDGFAVSWDANRVGMMCGYREHLLKHYRERLEEVQQGFDGRYEPGRRDTKLFDTWKSEYPNIDIRHSGNLTHSKWSPKDFRDKSTCVNWQESTAKEIDGWPFLSDIL